LNRAIGRACNSNQGICDGKGACKAVQNLDLSLSAFSKWIVGSWYYLYAAVIFILLVACCMRWQERKRDAGVFVSAQIKTMGTIVKRAITPRAMSVRFTKEKKALPKATKPADAKWKEMAIFLEEQNKDQKNKLKDRDVDEGLHRLQVMFPHTRADVIRQMMKLSPHEEAAVLRLLHLGHPMWKIPDYKLLSVASKRVAYLKQQGLVKEEPHRAAQPQAQPQHHQAQQAQRHAAPPANGKVQPRKAPTHH
jgi:primosomal protein N'